MTMQSLHPPKSRGEYTPYAARKSTATTGNYRRIHQELLNIADKDGVFQTTDASKEIMRRLGVGLSSAASSIFQWSDPTGERGLRRVRLYSPRVAKSTPNEMPEEKAKPKDIHWASRAFADVPEVNKKGPFYLAPGKGLHRGDRKFQMVDELFEFQQRFEASDGFWNLREGVVHMADLGFNPTSVYHVIREGAYAGGVEKKGWTRRIKPEYLDSLRMDNVEGDQGLGGVESEGIPTGVNTEAVNDADHLQSTEANKERLEESINSFQHQPEGFRPAPPSEALRQKVEALVESTLSAPETIRAIDKLVGEAILASARRQLGVRE